MLRIISLAACVNLIACATTQDTTVVRNPNAIKVFNEAAAQRDALRAEWTHASAEDHKYCEIKVGECEMQVNDRRDDLISAHGNPVCRAKSNSDQEAQCIADELAKLGNPEPANGYFTTDVWCLKRLNQCVAKHQNELAEKARVALIAHRRNALESSRQGIVWHARVAAAAEKVKYIRATLPPDADGECRQSTDNSKCGATIDRYESDLGTELAKSEAEYDAKKAQKLYEELTKTQASCYEPELKCLSKSVAKYGETNESRRFLQRNFDLLDKRQRLIEKAGDQAAEPCIESAVASHKADIVQSYRAYVREPVLYFRTQLHRSFIALHKSEIDCLDKVEPTADFDG
jgi:hypothetical protein